MHTSCWLVVQNQSHSLHRKLLHVNVPILLPTNWVYCFQCSWSFIKRLHFVSRPILGWIIVLGDVVKIVIVTAAERTNTFCHFPVLIYFCQSRENAWRPCQFTMLLILRSLWFWTCKVDHVVLVEVEHCQRMVKSLYYVFSCQGYLTGCVFMQNSKQAMLYVELDLRI